MIRFINKFAFGFRRKIDEFFHKESGEVNVVAIVVLIGIAVLLAIIFRTQITSLLNSLFSSIKTNASSAIK